MLWAYGCTVRLLPVVAFTNQTLGCQTRANIILFQRVVSCLESPCGDSARCEVSAGINGVVYGADILYYLRDSFLLVRGRRLLKDFDVHFIERIRPSDINNKMRFEALVLVTFMNCHAGTIPCMNYFDASWHTETGPFRLLVGR
jgi:hypothetical protein